MAFNIIFRKWRSIVLPSVEIEFIYQVKMKTGRIEGKETDLCEKFEKHCTLYRHLVCLAHWQVHSVLWLQKNENYHIYKERKSTLTVFILELK